MLSSIGYSARVRMLCVQPTNASDTLTLTLTGRTQRTGTHLSVGLAARQRAPTQVMSRRKHFGVARQVRSVRGVFKGALRNIRA